jgi:hypothetical protein
VGGTSSYSVSNSRRSSVKPSRNQSYEPAVEELELHQEAPSRRKSLTTSTTSSLSASSRKTKKQIAQTSARKPSLSASSSLASSSSSGKALYIDNQDEEIFGVVDEMQQQEQEQDDDVLSAVNEDSFDEVDRVEYEDEDISFTRHPRKSDGKRNIEEVQDETALQGLVAAPLVTSNRKSVAKPQDIYDFPDLDNDAGDNIDDQVVNDLGHVSDGSGVFDGAEPQFEEEDSNINNGNDEEEEQVAVPKRRGRKPGSKNKSSAAGRKKKAATVLVEYNEDHSQDEAERVQIMTERALLKKKQIEEGSMVTVGRFEQPGRYI